MDAPVTANVLANVDAPVTANVLASVAVPETANVPPSVVPPVPTVNVLPDAIVTLSFNAVVPDTDSFADIETSPTINEFVPTNRRPVNDASFNERVPGVIDKFPLDPLVAVVSPSTKLLALSSQPINTFD